MIQKKIDLAFEALKSNNLIKAKKLFEDAISIDPNLPAVYNILGNIELNSGNAQGSIKLFQKAIELNPNFSGAFCNLGLAFKRLQNEKFALDNYFKAIDKDPKNFKAYFNLGNLYKEKNDLNNAEKFLLKTIEPITAHAEGNISAKIPARFAGLNVDDAVEASLPYLDVEKARSSQAETTTQLIKNWHKRLGGKSATPEDINKLKSVISRIKPLDLESFEKFQKIEDAHWLSKAEGNTNALKRIFKEGSEVYNKLPGVIKLGAGMTALGAALDVREIHAGGVQAEQEKGDTMQSKYKQAAGRLRQASGSTGLSGTGAGMLLKSPTTAAVGGLSSIFTGLAAWRLEHLAENYESPLMKMFGSPKHIPANTESGVAEIKPLTPQVPNLKYIK